MDDKATVIVRIDKDALRAFDEYVKRAGISREEYIRTLCGIVTRLDCRPSDVTKLHGAYYGE